MILRSSLLSRLPWLDHGFGTRSAGIDQSGMASLKQVHSSIVLDALGPGVAGEGDALVSHQPGLRVSVRTADCYPILLVDARQRKIAAVHAGWRGTAAGIVRAALDRMLADPAHTIAAIGPGIGVCCYEVGGEVAAQFGLSGRSCIDLASANRDQLLVAGLSAENIEILGNCTFCEAHLFYSYRREKESAGRLISFVGLKSDD